MTLSDASPLVALINARYQSHERCMAALPGLTAPLLTTWPAFTEAMYLLHKYGGYAAQEALWGYVRDGLLVFHSIGPEEQARMAELMDRYRDRPMDLADASLVAAAESLGSNRIFTLDRRDFTIYRFQNSGVFDIVP
jgi:predicted nucleic acid-binding protein